jgi:hypothetical protein
MFLKPAGGAGEIELEHYYADGGIMPVLRYNMSKTPSSHIIEAFAKARY